MMMFGETRCSSFLATQAITTGIVYNKGLLCAGQKSVQAVMLSLLVLSLTKTLVKKS